MNGIYIIRTQLIWNNLLTAGIFINERMPRLRLANLSIYIRFDKSKILPQEQFQF